MTLEHKVDEILTLVKQERQVNNGRFNQLVARMDHMDQVFRGLKGDITKLNGKIDEVYHALSEDIQVFAGDQDKLKRRVDKIERKIALRPV